MSERIVSPEEATRARREELLPVGVSYDEFLRDLAFTVVEQSKQIAAALALHKHDADNFCLICVTEFGGLIRYPCPTAQALGDVA